MDGPVRICARQRGGGQAAGLARKVGVDRAVDRVGELVQLIRYPVEDSVGAARATSAVPIGPIRS